MLISCNIEQASTPHLWGHLKTEPVEHPIPSIHLTYVDVFQVNIQSAEEGASCVTSNVADKTAILYAGQNDKAPTIDTISELFPAYFERLEYDLKAYYGFLSENFAFSLFENEAVTNGDYKMHKFVGIIEFDNDGAHCKYPFIAYATTLKSNGAYAYRVVYDVSDDQSNGDLIAEHALNMAKTFREEQ